MTSFKIGNKIGNRSIGVDTPPFIIAEMSGNHYQSLNVVPQIVEAPAKAGTNALNLQTYTAETITLDLFEVEFFIKDPNSFWVGSSV